MKRTWIIFIILMVSQVMLAQRQSVGCEPLSPTDHFLHLHSDSIHSSLKPFNPGFETLFFETGQLKPLQKDHDVLVYPTGGVQMGGQVANSQRVIGLSTAGVGLSYQPNNRIFATLNYTSVVSAPSDNYRRLADSLRIIPGVGLIQQNNGSYFVKNLLTGRAIWNAKKYFSLEIGNGKHFWGDGYRTLILSHNAAPFPYARLTTKIWKIKYVNLWAQMRDITNSQGYSDARRKYTSMHALSWQATRNLNFTLYEMVVWQATDTLLNRGLDLNYLNPIIFFRPVEYSQGSADNVLLGLSWKWKFNKKNQVYGQLMFDEFLLFELKRALGWWANKFGVQLGMKNFDVFTPGLHVMNELNVVRPFTYTHGSVTQAFGHMNQGLAHPFGTNFLEWINLWRYERDDWYVSQKFIWGIWGRDTDDDNWGGNIFRSYRNPSFQYGNHIAQGLKSTFFWEEITFGKKLSAKTDLWGFASTALRFERNDHNQYVDLMLNLGIRTTLFPAYRDF